MNTQTIIDQFNKFHYVDLKYIHKDHQADALELMHILMERQLVRAPRERLYVKTIDAPISPQMTGRDDRTLIIKVRINGPFYNRTIAPLLASGDPVPECFEIVDTL